MDMEGDEIQSIEDLLESFDGTEGYDTYFNKEGKPIWWGKFHVLLHLNSFSARHVHERAFLLIPTHHFSAKNVHEQTN
jgi:hypothetical protein